MRPRSRSWDSNGSGAIGFPERMAGLGLPMPALSVPTIRWVLNPNDPYGQDDIVIENDDLHLPVGKSVKGTAPLNRRPA